MSKKITLPESYIVNMYGIELQVYGYYEAPEDETNSPQGVEITEVNHADECIIDLLSEGVKKSIECNILENYF